MVRVKICGLTSLEDALAAAHGGADALGFVFAPSLRQVSREQARSIIRHLPPLIMTVGVFVNPSIEEVLTTRTACGLDIIQLHGQESEEMASQIGGRVIKALGVGPETKIDLNGYPEALLLLDTATPKAAGGTGRTFDWGLARGLTQHRRIVLAGGLKPENVVEAINIVQPYAVDVSSGVEINPGRKDHERMSLFIRRAKGLS